MMSATRVLRVRGHSCGYDVVLLPHDVSETSLISTLANAHYVFQVDIAIRFTLCTCFNLRTCFILNYTS